MKTLRCSIARLALMGLALATLVPAARAADPAAPGEAPTPADSMPTTEAPAATDPVAVSLAEQGAAAPDVPAGSVAGPADERPELKGHHTFAAAGLTAAAGVGMLGAWGGAPLWAQDGLYTGFYVGMFAGSALAVAGTTQLAVSHVRRSRWDRAYTASHVPAPPTEADRATAEDATTRRERMEARWAHLEGQRRVGRGTAMIIGGSGGMLLAAAPVGASFAMMASCDGWGCVGGGVVVLASIGLGTAIAVPSLALIGVGSGLVVSGKKQQRENAVGGQQVAMRLRRPYILPVVHPNGVAVSLSCAF